MARERGLLVAFQVSADRTPHERGRPVGLGAKTEPLNLKPTIMVGKTGRRVNRDDCGEACELSADINRVWRRSINHRFDSASFVGDALASPRGPCRAKGSFENIGPEQNSNYRLWKEPAHPFSQGRR